LPTKLATMRQNILSQLSDHPHVNGVVISSASTWPQGTIIPDEYEDECGGHALRCAIALAQFDLPKVSEIFTTSE
jgi:hypothetical protein